MRVDIGSLLATESNKREVTTASNFHCERRRRRYGKKDFYAAGCRLLHHFVGGARAHKKRSVKLFGTRSATKKLIERHMPADVFASEGDRSVRPQPNSRMRTTRETSELFGLSNPGQPRSVMLQIKALCKGKRLERTHDPLETFRTADAAAGAAGHCAAMFFELPKRF